MELVHFPATATPDEIAACINEHGYAIIDELAGPEVMDRLQAEVDPYVTRTRFGSNDITGRLTRRTGSLVARSPTARQLIMNMLVNGVVSRCISSPSAFQLSLTEVISLSPGAPAQFIHRDSGPNLAPGYIPQISTLWALTDYTEEMGATLVIPGSHRLPPDMEFTTKDATPAVMNRGSILIYNSNLYHGGGENRSQRVRQAVNVNYVVGWLRQEENQYLSCPPEIARMLPDDLLKLMGYRTLMGFGRVGDWADPLSVVRGETKVLDEQEEFKSLL